MEPKSKGKYFLFNGIAENTRVKKDYVENQRYLLARVWIFVKCIVLSVNVLEGKINAENLVL